MSYMRERLFSYTRETATDKQRRQAFLKKTMPATLPGRSGNHLFVAAIDFGTTYSGYAFALRDEFQKNPLTIYTNTAAIGDSNGLITLKVPTSVLFDRDKKFHSFGYNAEDKYADLVEDEGHVGWRYFSRFKMLLHNRRTNLMKAQLKDDNGERMLAIDVFTAAIKFMKDDLLEMIKDRFKDLDEGDVAWVLTVPAIWNEGAKQFMRAAASNAGIPGERLTLALEPESAAVYCKEVAVSLEKTTSGQSFVTTFKAGARYMLIDLGGGTADITVQEVQEDGHIVELVAPSGGPWGGMVVDDAFCELLKDICTDKVIQKLKTEPEYKVDDLDIQRSFELKKRTIDPSKDANEVSLKVPTSLFDIIADVSHKNFSEAVDSSNYRGLVKRKRDKLNFKTHALTALFDQPIDELIDHIQHLLADPLLGNLRTLVFVGGFSESKLVKFKIKEAFPSNRYTVIAPPDAQLAVVKGAVIYGFNPDAITSRKMQFTYGVSTAVPFDPEKHKLSKQVDRDGYEKCEDVFKVFVTAGQTVVPGNTVVEHLFQAPSWRSISANIEVYKTLAKSPAYVDDDGCERVGTIQLALIGDVETLTYSKKIVRVQMHFGDTELKVSAVEDGTGNKIDANFRFL